MKCYKCGNENEEGAFTCTNCGAPLEVTEELIQDAVSGNDVAIEAIYNITYQNVFEEAGVFVKDDDALSNVIISTYGQVFALLDKIKAPLALTNLLKQKANQNAMDYLKTASPEIFADEEYNEQAIQLPINKDATVDKNEFMNSLKSVLNTPDYVTSMLVYGKGKSIDEVSKLFGISKSTVKARLKRANNEISGLDLKAIPPLFTLFGSLLKGSAPVVPSSAIVQVASVQGTTKSATIISEATKDATSTATKQVAKTATKEAGKTVAKGAAKATAGKGIVGTVMAHKVAAGVVAASIAVGGVGTGVIAHKNIVQQEERANQKKTTEEKNTKSELSDKEKKAFAQNKAALEEELKNNSQGLTIVKYIEDDFDSNGKTEAVVAAYKPENANMSGDGILYFVYINDENKAVWNDSQYTFTDYAGSMDEVKLRNCSVISILDEEGRHSTTLLVKDNKLTETLGGNKGIRKMSGDYFYGYCEHYNQVADAELKGSYGNNSIPYIYQYKDGEISEVVGKDIGTDNLKKYSNGQSILNDLSGYKVKDVILKKADKTYIYVNVYKAIGSEANTYELYYLSLYVDGNKLKYVEDGLQSGDVLTTAQKIDEETSFA